MSGTRTCPEGCLTSIQERLEALATKADLVSVRTEITTLKKDLAALSADVQNLSGFVDPDVLNVRFQTFESSIEATLQQATMSLGLLVGLGSSLLVAFVFATLRWFMRRRR